MTEQWKSEQQAFAERDLSGVDYVDLWADGIHVNVRLGDQAKLCLLVMIGVRADGREGLVALTDGYREAAESWADLLRDCRRRGMRAPVLAAADGALGFWSALREVVPGGPRATLCWFHMISNVLAALPKSAHPGAKKALAEIWNAEDKSHAYAVKGVRVDLWCEVSEGGRQDHRRRRGVAGVLRHSGPALDPSEDDKSDRIDLRHRAEPEQDHQGPRLPCPAGIAMAYKLIEAAQSRWRAVNAPHLVALVRAGAMFENGKLVERPVDTTATEEAA
jgi:Transposase, Mutator family